LIGALVVEKSYHTAVAKFLKNAADGLLGCFSATSAVGYDAVLFVSEQVLARESSVWILRRLPTNGRFYCFSPSHSCLASADYGSQTEGELK